ncbi:MAG TPA: hypothetical protein VGC99_01015 [Candidatus Tectomicrobia bacterium]
MRNDRAAQGWSQQLHAWWVAHQAARQQARLTSLNTCWDAQHEACTPLRAESAYDMAVAQGHGSTATQLFGLL